MRKRTSDKPVIRSESGQAVIMVSMGVVFLFGLLGMVVDVGYSYYIKQVAQAAADSAAIAATVMANASGGTCGTAVLCQSNTVCSATPNNPPVTDFDSACLYASKNGFPSTGNQTVKVSGGTGNPPAASGVSANYWVTVTATQSLNLSFLRVMGLTNATVSAQSTGALIGTGGGGCIYVMDPSGDAAMNVTGTGYVQSDCGVYVNSTASDALRIRGTSTLNANVINVVGGVRTDGTPTVNPNPTTGYRPRRIRSRTCKLPIILGATRPICS